MIEARGHPEARYELPSAIAGFAGRINDVDAHEAIPISLWVDEFGSVVKEYADALGQTELGNALVKDDAEINAESVWNLKMESAPGAFDFARRLEVMDFTGVSRQLIYPGALGLTSVAMYTSSDDTLFQSMPITDRKAYARQLHRAYNDWCGRISSGSDRLRAVAILIGDTPDDLVSEVKRLLKQGVRAFWVPTGRPPAGLSPADPALDKMWALLADSNSPVLGHIGGEYGLLASMAWKKAPAFEGWRLSGEFSLDPWSLSAIHLPVQNYLTTMILGGVFERHPTLRFGAAEFTGHWIGPMAENLDRWSENQPFRTSGGTSVLKMKPSEYIRRNVRIMCFDFEPVGHYIDQFGLEEVYCYASDYPHYEGGKDPMGRFVNSLSTQSPDVLRKFFIENGELLLPD